MLREHQGIVCEKWECKKLIDCRKNSNGNVWSVAIAMRNLKRNFLGVYHKIKGKYLQTYLNELCYKPNRRYLSEYLFDRVAVASVFCGK